MVYIFIISFSLLVGLMYVRYFPVPGVSCFKLSSIDKNHVQLVDIREYNLSYKDPIPEAINIPVAYLKRNYHEISSSTIHVIASDPLEKNIGIRSLRKKGFKIASYTVIECECEEQQTA